MQDEISIFESQSREFAKLPIHCQVPHAAKVNGWKAQVQVQQYAVKCGAHIPEHLL